jgi:predicted helicase
VITAVALAAFRKYYDDKKISKWDIFHYVYAVLQHPGYQSSFAEAFKRDLPRIPFAPDFKAFAKAGVTLAKLHLGYEDLEPWPLEWVPHNAERLNYRVSEKMHFTKSKDALWVNSSLTLTGIPSEALLFRMGSRSPLEWLIDQYQVTEAARSGIKFDPNRKVDHEYVIRLIGQVIRLITVTTHNLDTSTFSGFTSLPLVTAPRLKLKSAGTLPFIERTARGSLIAIRTWVRMKCTTPSAKSMGAGYSNQRLPSTRNK